MTATPAPPLSPTSATRLAQYAATASVSVAIALVVLKTIAWAKTGSVAMLGSLMDSALDAAASTLNLLAVRAASEPADREHRFGHGKIEAIAGLGQALLILASGLFIVVQAVRGLVTPHPMEGGELGIAVTIIAMIATAALVLYQRMVVARTGSVAISADALHYTGDLALNATVILALLLAGPLHLPRADAVFGLIVAVLIGRNSLQIMQVAINQLLDRELSDGERQRIRSIIMSHPEVRNMHDLRTRVSGYDTFIQFHIELEPKMALDRAHEISDQVEASVREAFPGAQVLIHEDPVGLERPPVFPPGRFV